MSHLTEEDLILHYYGEAADPAPVERHLDTCPDCRAAYGSLERVLNVMDGLPVPERAEDYGAAVWRRLRETGLRPAFWRRPFVRWPVMVLAFASVLAAVLLVHRPAPKPPLSREGEKQILNLAVGDYLDRSGIVLTELANTGSADISTEQDLAADLLAECRLYRQTALRFGDSRLAGRLDSLERVLVEIAHAPARLEPEQLDELRERVRGMEHRL